MTKKEMIEDIQVAEAKAWNQYQRDVKQNGKDDPITDRSRTAWAALYRLRESLGIPRTAWAALYRLRESLGIPGMAVERLYDLNLLPG